MSSDHDYDSDDESEFDDESESEFDDESESGSESDSDRGNVASITYEIPIAEINNRERLAQGMVRGIRYKVREASKNPENLSSHLNIKLMFVTPSQSSSPEFPDLIDIILEVKTESDTGVPRRLTDSLLDAIWEIINEYHLGYYNGVVMVYP